MARAATAQDFISGTPLTYQTVGEGTVTARYSRHSRKWPWTGQLTIRKGKGGRGKVLHEAPMPEYAAENFFRAAGLAEAD